MQAAGVLLSSFPHKHGKWYSVWKQQGCPFITDMEGRARQQSMSKGWPCPSPSEPSI